MSILRPVAATSGRPLAAPGRSLFWANLNQGKRSVTIDHRHPDGRARRLTSHRPDSSDAVGGIYVDNMVGSRRLEYAELAERRPDLIYVHVEGRQVASPLWTTPSTPRSASP